MSTRRHCDICGGLQESGNGKRLNFENGYKDVCSVCIETVLASQRNKGETEFAAALSVVARALQTDPALYIGYVSNIAMAFSDEIVRRGIYYPSGELHFASNAAAHNFLYRLMQKK